MTGAEIFALGCLGGALPDVLRLIKGRHDGAPQFLRDWFFWLMFADLVLLGGAAALLGRADEAMEAVAFGFTAPEVVSRAFGGGRSDLLSRPDGGLMQRLRWWWAI
ncbi:MAG: hypothetical protein JF625_23000 [Inquilinus limosus]|uniref:Uncharacterized protein n=1 Tax=Inquilinus limosus TaxID=171674 RepID=A0A952FNF9_9PROT|nr:hypothetical protein [Inquilinus limosus]